jgi:hypothetical protein
MFLFSLRLSFPFAIFASNVLDAGQRPADPPHPAMRGALHGTRQPTKLPDTTYGAYALKPYNI